MNQTQKRVTQVLQNMIERTQQDEDDAEMYSNVLEDVLNNIQGDDGFGTESQCDPRGDGRDGEWSMDYVQGVDD